MYKYKKRRSNFGKFFVLFFLLIIVACVSIFIYDIYLNTNVYSHQESSATRLSYTQRSNSDEKNNKDITDKKDYKLQPKVEISYMRAGKDTTKVRNGVSDLAYDSTNYLAGKAAIMIAYNKERYNHLFIEPLVELAYNQEFLGKGNVRYGGAETKTSLNGGTFEITAGLNMQITNDLYWHVLGSYEIGNKINAWGINTGIRVTFGNSV